MESLICLQDYIEQENVVYNICYARKTAGGDYQVDLYFWFIQFSSKAQYNNS